MLRRGGTTRSAGPLRRTGTGELAGGVFAAIRFAEPVVGQAGALAEGVVDLGEVAVAIVGEKRCGRRGLVWATSRLKPSYS
jgi:hypothetical protein